jgi:hypothetical protein
MVSRTGASGPPRAQNHAEAGEAHCEQRQRCGLRHGGSSDHAEAGEVPVVPGVAARQAAARDIVSWYEKFTAVLVNADAVAAAAAGSESAQVPERDWSGVPSIFIAGSERNRAAGASRCRLPAQGTPIRHFFAAAVSCGASTALRATNGSRRDAPLYSLSANARHVL